MAFDPSGELTGWDFTGFHEGHDTECWKRLGAHEMTITDSERGPIFGTRFSVWAPNAQAVRLVGDFNYWNGENSYLQLVPGSGVWALFMEGVSTGNLYKFEILGSDGVWRTKADPMARFAESPPHTASIVYESQYAWSDDQWMWYRGERKLHEEPISVYEARIGSPDEFRHLVDALHRAGIGVLIDWVPGHFATDPWALQRFDGTALYEHEDPRLGWHPDWGSYIFNFGRNEVKSFLVSNAYYWLHEFHIDGLRVDAVASMLYLDYSREAGQWVPNKYGSNENLEAIEMLQLTNKHAYEREPGTMMVAEESTSWPGVTRPVNWGGLGFGFKWNMGWMNDSLRYLGREPIYRQFHHHEMTFAMAYAYSENFILPISHDEVVHGKGSMFERIPQDEWRKFGNLRAFYAFMWAHPGKKLLFMGTEFGQRREFSEDRSIDWWQSAEWGHRGLQRLVKDLNTIYRENPALWKADTDPSGFSWIDADDHGGNIFSWLRYDGEGQMIACITNFSSESRPDHQIGLPREGVWKEILNTDAEVYDGTGHIGNLGQVVATNVPSHGYVASAAVTIPPLGAVWLRFEPVSTEEQPEPDKVEVGVRAAARAVSPHLNTAAVDPEEVVAVPREDPVQPADTKPLGRVNEAAPAAGSPAEGLLGGPADDIPAPSIPDPMSRAEAASATQPIAPPTPEAAASPGSPESPESPASPNSPSSPDMPPTPR